MHFVKRIAQAEGEFEVALNIPPRLELPRKSTKASDYGTELRMGTIKTFLPGFVDRPK